MEIVQPFSQQGQDKEQCLEFLLHFKVQSFGACRWLLSSFSPHQGGLACSQLLSISRSLLELVFGAHRAMGHATAGATWFCAHHQVDERDREAPS